MLEKNKKLTGVLFKEVFEKGKKMHGNCFWIKFLKKEEDIPHSNFAFVVSKKITKKAVDRNLLRRRGFNAIKEILKEKEKTNKNYKIIFFVKSEIKNLSFEELKLEIKDMFLKIGIIE